MIKNTLVNCLAGIAIILAAAGLVSGCDRVIGSGNLETTSYNITDFTEVEVSYAFTVEVSRASSYNVAVTVDSNLVPYLDVRKTGNALHIGFNRPVAIIRSTQRAVITMPDLRRLELSGASKGTITGFQSTNPLTLDISGASSVELVNIKAGDGNFDISGASRISGNATINDGSFDVSGASSLELAGSANDIRGNASGASRLRLEEFAVVDADIEVSGASSAIVNASGRLDVEASGASSVTYVGNPTLGDIDVSGASSVKRK